jgi:hypothetical protein
MEEMIDFDKWLVEQNSNPLDYVAVYDPLTGTIKSILPKGNSQLETFKIDITNELAEFIFSGKINSNQCIVDLETGSIEILETEDITTIDQILHRVIEKKNSKTNEYDIHITYDRANFKLIFELSSYFGGTFQDRLDAKKKKVLWDKNTNLDFLITSYNDPNILFEVMSFKISDMFNQSKIFENIKLPKKFNIFYTNRLMKNYVFIEL